MSPPGAGGSKAMPLRIMLLEGSDSVFKGGGGCLGKKENMDATVGLDMSDG